MEDILKHADELTKRFENYEPKAQDERDPEAVNMLRWAVVARLCVERSIRDVDHTRLTGLPSALIGSVIGPGVRRPASALGYRARDRPVANSVSSFDPGCVREYTFCGRHVSTWKHNPRLEQRRGML